MVDDIEHVTELVLLNSELAHVKDFDVLMERILKSAREFLHCDAGSIYIRHGDMLEFSYAQNDTLQNLEPNKKLIYKTFILPINNESIAGHVAATGETVNVPDAYEMDDHLPYRFDKSYDQRAGYNTRSILTVPLETTVGDIIGVMQLINAYDDKGNNIPFRPEAEPYVIYFMNSAANALERALLMRTMILRMVKMTELRDPKETGDHVRRVGGYSMEIYETWAKKKGVSHRELLYNRDVLHMAAMLHDVGKAAISDVILKKPGKLTDEEFGIMKWHAIYGSQLLEYPASEYEKAAQMVALNHHERYDGSGYPGHVDPTTGEPLEGFIEENGLARPKRGDEIPLFGRIVAIADVYDALSFQRVYKEAWEQENVLAYIWDQSGKHFDPELVDAFFESLLVIGSIAERYSKNEMTNEISKPPEKKDIE